MTALCRVVLCFAVEFCDSLLNICVVLLLLLLFYFCSYCFVVARVVCVSVVREHVVRMLVMCV